jgi:hypothetical protein
MPITARVELLSSLSSDAAAFSAVTPVLGSTGFARRLLIIGVASGYPRSTAVKAA